MVSQALPIIRDNGIYFYTIILGAMINGGVLGETELLSILKQVSLYLGPMKL